MNLGALCLPFPSSHLFLWETLLLSLSDVHVLEICESCIVWSGVMGHLVAMWQRTWVVSLSHGDVYCPTFFCASFFPFFALSTPPFPRQFLPQNPPFWDLRSTLSSREKVKSFFLPCEKR